jgi:branched-chain amino acid transport system ATP-binding protein
MLEVSGLTVRYGPFLALNGIDVDIPRGQIVGVVGPNGAGKSSLVRSIAGLVRPVAGVISFDGEDLGKLPAHQRIRRGISLVPEGRGLFPQMSVEENLMMGGYSLSEHGQMTHMIGSCFEMFPVLRERRYQLAGTLSGGQQQMLAISMGLMAKPRICVLDEPSLGLAPIVIQDIASALKRLREVGMTVLLAEQNATLTCSVADVIYVIHSGEIRYHDTPDRLFENEQVVESFLSL